MGRPRLCNCGNCDHCRRRAHYDNWCHDHPGYHRENYQPVGDRAAKQAHNRRPWTAEDDAQLGTNYDNHIAALLDRPVPAVRDRRIKLGIERHRKLTGGGYHTTTLPKGHHLSDMARSGRAVLTHRLVMARHLGRPLTKDEIVHHRNGIRTDNRINNLELWTRAHPDGQRIEDKFNWALDFIERYANELDTPVFSQTTPP